MSFFNQNSNNFCMKNKILHNDLIKNEEEFRNTSIDSNNSYRRHLFQRQKTNRFIQNNKMNFPQSKLGSENHKVNINTKTINNNDSYLNNFFNKTEGNSQISYNNSKRDLSLKDTITHNQSQYNLNKPIRVESCENFQTRNNKLDYIIIPEYSTTQDFYIENNNNIHKRNLTDENNVNLKEITKSDYLKIVEKFSKLVIQLEDYQKIIKDLKDENQHLKNLINQQNNDNFNNRISYNNLNFQKDESSNSSKIDYLTNQLNSLNKEYESYKKLTESRLNCFKNLNNKNDVLKEISRLKSENLNLKNQCKILQTKYETSDTDYAQLLKRNESLNREIFRLRNYVSSKKLINTTSITHFSIEIKNAYNKRKYSYKKGDLTKRINTVLLVKNKKYNTIDTNSVNCDNNRSNINTHNNSKNTINNINKKLIRENSSQAEIMISTLESENNSLIHKVQKLECQLHNYLKSKSNKTRRLEQCQSWSKA